MNTTNLPTTLVVLGAGASVDCYATEASNLVNLEPGEYLALPEEMKQLAMQYDGVVKHTPPLTVDLVNSLRPHALGCAQLLSIIETHAKRAAAAGSRFDFEDTLRTIFKNVGSNMPDEFLALRKAIAKRMRLADEIGMRVPTLYTELFARFNHSPKTQGRQFAVLNMNYDRLAEYAINNQAIKPLIEQNVSKFNRIDLFQPHGNCAWTMTKDQLPQGNESLPLFGNTTNHVCLNNPTPKASDAPAIALPMYGDDQSKTVWPQSHVDALKVQLRTVNHIIVIGWRGADKEIVDLVEPILNHIPVKSMHLVSRSSRGTSEMRTNLASWAVAPDIDIVEYSSGFREYVDDMDSPLEQLYPL